MYTGTFKNNLLLVAAFILSTITVYTVESYFTAKEEARDEFFRTGKPVPEASYLAYVSNGFTLNDVH